MKRLISFILGAVLITVLSIHNSVMAFGDSIDMTMGNHMAMESQVESCHGEDLDDCVSICCVVNDFSTQVSNTNIQNNKKLFDKLIYSFIELSFEQSFIYEWNLIGNISPPIGELTIDKYNYISLTGIIKSNT